MLMKGVGQKVAVLKYNDVPQAEARALIALYNATGGASWTNKTNWITDPTVDNWYGITVAGGHVTQINLSSNNLNGTWTAAMLTPLTALTQLRAYSNASLICSFTLSDLPAGMTYLSLYSTTSTITGGAAPMAAKGICEIRTDNCGEIQATVDDVFLRLYTDRMLFIYATPVLNIGGDNDNPSGIYQAQCPPATGLERAYELVNDSCGDGFIKWTVTY